MLDNPMCHLLLKPLLQCLKVQIHDVSESVRLAMMQLLLKVKCIKSIKVNGIMGLVCKVGNVVVYDVICLYDVR